MTPEGEDPFGRRGEERTDAFGRPIEGDQGSESLWSGHVDRDEPEARDEPPRFLPPTDAPPPADEPRFAPPTDPAPPAGDEPRFAPPTDASPPATGGFAPPTPDAPSWWADPNAGAGTHRGPSGPAPASVRAPASAPDVANLAGYGERIGAALVDFLVRAGITAVLMIVLVAAAADDEAAATAGFFLGFYLLTPFYAPIAMTRWPGQTLGHRVVNTRIVTRQGAPVTGGKAFVREYLTKYLLVEVVGGLMTLGIFTLVNYLWPLWDQKNEALHDKMCDTRVVNA